MKKEEEKSIESKLSYHDTDEVISATLHAAVLFLGSGVTEATINKTKVKNLVSLKWVEREGLVVKIRDQKTNHILTKLIPSAAVKNVDFKGVK